MAELIFAESYFETIAQIESPKLQDRLLSLLELLSEVPTFGSRKVRGWLRERFGETCMTADLSPFLFVFEYIEKDGIVFVYGIVHQREIR